MLLKQCPSSMHSLQASPSEKWSSAGRTTHIFWSNSLRKLKAIRRSLQLSRSELELVAEKECFKLDEYIKQKRIWMGYTEGKCVKFQMHFKSNLRLRLREWEPKNLIFFFIFAWILLCDLSGWKSSTNWKHQKRKRSHSFLFNRLPCWLQ